MLYDSQSVTIAHGMCRGRAAGRTEPPDARTPPWAIRRHQRCWRRRRALPATGARRTVPLSPAQRQEFLTRALGEGGFFLAPAARDAAGAPNLARYPAGTAPRVFARRGAGAARPRYDPLRERRLDRPDTPDPDFNPALGAVSSSTGR